jgi:hypothetical protein
MLGQLGLGKMEQPGLGTLWEAVGQTQDSGISGSRKIVPRTADRYDQSPADALKCRENTADGKLEAKMT